MINKKTVSDTAVGVCSVCYTGNSVYRVSAISLNGIDLCVEQYLQCLSCGATHKPPPKPLQIIEMYSPRQGDKR